MTTRVSQAATLVLLAALPTTTHANQATTYAPCLSAKLFDAFVRDANAEQIATDDRDALWMALIGGRATYLLVMDNGPERGTRFCLRVLVGEGTP